MRSLNEMERKNEMWKHISTLGLAAVLTACATDAPTTPRDGGVATVTTTSIDADGRVRSTELTTVETLEQPTGPLPLFEVPALMPDLIGIIKMNVGGQTQAKLLKCSFLPGGIMEVVPEGVALNQYDSLDSNHAVVRYGRRSEYGRDVKARQVECPKHFLAVMSKELIGALRGLDELLRDQHPKLFLLTRNQDDSDMNPDNCSPNIQVVQLDIRVQSDVPDGSGGVNKVLVDSGYQVAGVYGDLPLTEQAQAAGFTQFLPIVHVLPNGELLNVGPSDGPCTAFL